ncbi:putative reverse transcriptase/RNA-dependent DNA polymerase [Citrus sinensis]|nr:putative reverse transcriptase/RNA-dependent DNA polymerase [Citrus sinensis]
MKFPDPPGCSRSNSSKWSIIWKLSLPEKIKIFVWKATKNLLPTAENLCKRGIVQEAHCKRCGNKVENILHVLVTCKAAKKVWQRSPVADAVHKIDSSNLFGELTKLQRSLSNDDFELLLVLLWIIWYARNKFVFEGMKIDPGISVAKAEAIKEAYKRTQFPEMLVGKNSLRQEQNKWAPPPPRWVKINVDAAIDAKSKCSGLGAVIKDPSGKCFVAAVKSVTSKGDVLLAEAEADEWGTYLAKEEGMQAVILETDSKATVDLINNNGNYMTEVHWIISDIQSLMSQFSHFVAKFIPRSCNTCAHKLAKIALGKTDSFVWKGNFPPEIEHVVSLPE